MASDADWVEDVRQWYFNSNRHTVKTTKVSDKPLTTETAELGYEAAHPALQARNWTESATSSFGHLR